jgi:hypothetical protein
MSSRSSGELSENGYSSESLVAVRASDEQELIPTGCGAGAQPYRLLTNEVFYREIDRGQIT